MNDLYETLGVSRDATPAEITKAYRMAARKHHPDHGGDKETFKAISSAYAILINKESRERYDTTGETPKARQPISKVEEAVNDMLLEAFLQDRVDPIRWMCDQMDRQRVKPSGHRSELLGIRKKLERKLKRFQETNASTKNEEGRDFVVMGLQSRIAEVDEGIAVADKDLQHISDVLTFLNDLKVNDFTSDANGMSPLIYSRLIDT